MASKSENFGGGKLLLQANVYQHIRSRWERPRQRHILPKACRHKDRPEDIFGTHLIFLPIIQYILVPKLRPCQGQYKPVNLRVSVRLGKSRSWGWTCEDDPARNNSARTNGLVMQCSGELTHGPSSREHTDLQSLAFPTSNLFTLNAQGYSTSPHPF